MFTPFILNGQTIKNRIVRSATRAYRAVCLLDLGYPAENGQPGPWHTQRKPLEETVTEL
jgi:nitroreductase